MNDPEAVQVFFLQQIELGEKFMASGDFEAGAKHFSYAILVIGNPGPILVRAIHFCGNIEVL